MKIAILQIPVSSEKAINLATAVSYIEKAAAAGAALAILPEMFCCPYSNDCFPLYGEEKGGLIYRTMSDAAARSHIALVAGSMPEWDQGKLYNTSFVFDATGRQIARHRKIHLFDINVDGGQSFQESAVFTAGQEITLFEVNGIKFGLAICFDIRFPELFREMTLQGAQAVIVPAAFNMTTGPAHWELTFRARALDNQYFTIGAAPARDTTSSYVSYANSIICSPWGQVLDRCGTDPALLLADLDFSQNAAIRRQLPLLSARKPEIYGMDR